MNLNLTLLTALKTSKAPHVFQNAVRGSTQKNILWGSDSFSRIQGARGARPFSTVSSVKIPILSTSICHTRVPPPT